MTRFLTSVCVAVVCTGAATANCFAQSPSSGSPAGQNPAPATQAQDSSTTAAPAEAKKKKVWTNDDVSSLSGPISVVGAKNGGKPSGTAAEGKADGQYIANTKKQLEKLQAQLDDTNKQLVAFKEFQEGKRPEPTGYQLNKGYNRAPVDEQIASLEAKKKDLEDKIGALLDEARKKGVLPGQLR